MLRQLLRSFDHFGQDRTRAEQGHALGRITGAVHAKSVAPAQHIGLHARRQVGLGVVLVHQGHVIKHVGLLLDHLTHARVQNHRQLARKRRVVGLAVGDGGRHQMAAAVLVLQALAAQGGAPRCGPQQKAPRPLVGRRPDGVAHALEAEHRVINIEGQHGQAVHAVAGGRCRPTGDRPGFADAFFQNLAVGGFAVAQHRADVFGRVALAHAAVNAHLLEQVGHAESARLVGHDGHDARAQGAVFEQAAQHAHKGHGGAHLFAVGLQRKLPVGAQSGHGQAVATCLALGQAAAQLGAVLAQVTHLGAVVGGFVKGQALDLLVAQRQVKAVAVVDQVLLVELLLAVRGHLALARAAHAKAFFGVRQDHRGLATVRGRRRIRRVDLHDVVPAALESVNLLVGHALRQPRQLFVLAKEVVAVVAPVLGGKGLHLAIDRVGKSAQQSARGVACQQAVPVAAPDQLDDVPARTGKQLFQFVDDAAIAPHRAVQSLQIAVHHPHQVVEFFSRGQGQGAHAFGLVHLAVAKHAPHLAGAAVLQLAVCQVTHEAGVVNRADRPQAHRAGGELPKVGHQPRVRVARQAASAAVRCGDFLAVVHQVLLAQAPFQKSAGIHPGGAVRLEEHQVALVLLGARMEEVVKPGLEQIGHAGVTGDVPTQLAIGLVGPHHHGQRVPTHDGHQPLFGGQVAWKHRLLVDGDGVHVRRVQLGLPAGALLARHDGQLVQNLAGPIWALGADQRQQGLSPLGGFFGVQIVGM